MNLYLVTVTSKVLGVEFYRATFDSLVAASEFVAIIDVDKFSFDIKVFCSHE